MNAVSKTSKQLVMPDFLGIGAQKCATTWLHFCLKAHPEIYVPYNKEVSYFNHNFDRGVEWYSRYFELNEGRKALGEITPCYMWCKESALRIFETIPEVRLIAILRNPMDRAFSQYKRSYRSGRVQTDFETALQSHNEYVERGLYYPQLKRYFDLFPRERILVLIYEDIVKNPEAVLREVYSFIGVREDFVPEIAHQVVAPEETVDGIYGVYLRLGKFLRKKMGLGGLIDQYKKTPFVKGADRLFHKYGPMANAKRKDKNGLGRPAVLEMSRPTRDRLRGIFMPDITRTQGLLKRDLSFWV